MAQRQYKMLSQQDFTGGLNYRADQFQLQQNESSDLLNVDVDPRGGIKQRDGIDAHNSTAVANNISGIWSHHETDGTNQIMVSHGNKIAYSTTGAFTDVIGGGGQPAVNTVTTRSRGITFNDNCYIQNGTDQPLKWNGTTASRLTQTFNNSTTPTNGNMPIAKHVAVWNEHVWVADTYESSTNHRSRVRWSHLDYAEDWNADHYVDIDIGEHGDYITALVPAGDRLLIFKQNSIHAIYGYDTSSFQSLNITHQLGARVDSTPVASPFGVFFWYADEGVYLLDDSNEFAWIFDRISPAIDDGRITFTNPPCLMWGKSRLFVSVDWGSNRRVFVFDPTFGAWVIHDVDVKCLYGYRPPGGSQSLLGAKDGRVLKLEQNRDSDRYDGASETHIDSYYRTAWFSAKAPTVKKRWGRPRTVVLADASISLPIEIYSDYDYATAHRSFSAVITGRSSTSVWDTATWQNVEGSSGNGVWVAAGSESATDVQRHPTLGTAMAVSMKVSGPTTNNTWELNAMTLTYMTRRVR